MVVWGSLNPGSAQIWSGKKVALPVTEEKKGEGKPFSQTTSVVPLFGSGREEGKEVPLQGMTGR